MATEIISENPLNWDKEGCKHCLDAALLKCDGRCVKLNEYQVPHVHQCGECPRKVIYEGARFIF